MQLQQHSHGRITLGLLVDWLEDDYQNTVLGGISDAASEHDANLIVFTGGALRSPLRFSVQRNVVYELAGPENVDGLMLMTGTIANFVGPAELARYCERFQPLPMCSIAVALPGTPSVLVDNATGTRQAIVHLIRAHGARRIAFLRGPDVNAEAERRFTVFRQVLEEHGIPLYSELVTVCDFQRPAGAAAVRKLLDERHVQFDALVAASDYIALGAMDELRVRGVRLPGDVAVVGFDDVEEARFETPPLTTVRQPLYEQGRRACEMLIASLHGESVPDKVILHTELVARRSCGCYSYQARPLVLRGADVPADTFDDTFNAGRRDVLKDMTQAMRTTAAGTAPGWAERLVDAFVADVKSGAPERFVCALEDILVEAAAHEGDLSRWQDVITALRRHALGPLATDADARSIAEDLLQQARLLVGSAVERAQGQHRLRAERWARTLSETGEALITTFDVVALMNGIATQFPRLQITSCYVALYDHEANPTEKLRLVLAYDEARPQAPSHAGTVYPARQLVPRELLPEERRHSYVVLPLFFKEHQLGIGLFETGPRHGTIYESLRDQVSAALKGALLVQEVIDKDKEQQRLLDDLASRATQLEEAYQALKEGQQKLLISEKMASLGRLTASIAHEMNTPLAAVRTALVELSRLVEEYRASVKDMDVTAEDHLEIAQEMSRAIDLAGGAAQRAADFVRGIKTHTRDMRPHQMLVFNAVPYIDEALMLLSHTLRKGKCRATFEHDSDELELAGSPGRLAQVVTNLVTNAIDASSPMGGGEIRLELRRRDGGVELSVTDQGVGISSDILSRVFEPMFTTKPFGQGTGLGLAIVHDIVTSDFGGSVEVQSTPGAGTTFRVLFPLSEER
ncbi:MAG: substrate-binding domain-containing protein [Polyangiaceae bacterium]|nr:substrate-binding domain-containing protein [Polyangiaceae bacterium]